MIGKIRTFRFLDFPVYQDAKNFYKQMVDLSKRFPREHWELADQLRRCALSVCLNIAEGSARYSDREFKHFLETAAASLNEAVACLDIARDNGLVYHSLFDEHLQVAEGIVKQIGGLIKKIRSSYG